MILYPAIDLKDGCCVRLKKGDFDQKTVYFENPVETALMWQNMGGEFLHLVDLDGAKDGISKNVAVIEGIVKALNIPVELGGGIRSMEQLERYFSMGVERAILGTAALKNPEFVRSAVQKYGDKIAVGIDAKDGAVAVSGWLEVSDTDAVTFAKEMEQIGVKHIIYTDIDTDGMMCGPNLKGLSAMVNAVPTVGIISSGGVASQKDLECIQKTGAAGAIIGKALYQKTINLTEAVNALKG
ncbi:MAG: 1-(5-phosphoribosyl)-5-[(5-phosphoribosylamino)methylideneamino]imidazole-4-carboxamide isomerase [Ruminococcaceae bacterium]|nr:1-(5-phosphoribosyl)-5-[(5-phosphoribosylamino)methylideneamino]imidazole-4-carboxamide isomerase [Oscillospiraceae bacterium]